MSDAIETAPKTVFDDVSAQVARSYADGLLGAVGDRAEEILGELESVRDEVFGAFPAFSRVLDSRTTSVADRDRILVNTLQGRIDPVSLNFLRVVNRHDRINLISLIVGQARLTWDRKQNRRQVSVRVAAPLDDAQQAALRDKIASWIQATPILTLTVDPSLIGGLIVQIDDDVFDASIRSRLESLRHRLIERKNYAEIQSR